MWTLSPRPKSVSEIPPRLFAVGGSPDQGGPSCCYQSAALEGSLGSSVPDGDGRPRVGVRPLWGPSRGGVDHLCAPPPAPAEMSQGIASRGGFLLGTSENKQRNRN